MDIYQIWTTYNKKWSKYEILAFSVLLLLTVIVVAGCVCRKKINSKRLIFRYDRKIPDYFSVAGAP